MDLRRRHRQEEWMDVHGVDPRRLNKSLRFIRIVNSALGYTRATLTHLSKFCGQWAPGQTITVLDVATGSGDIPLAIVRWGRRRGFDIHVTGLDRHPATAGVAADRCAAEPQIRIVRGDAMSLPFDAASFDYVISNMFLHHLDDADAVRVLREMDCVARRGIVCGDLLRHRRAYGWITLFTLFANPIVKHDARASVAQAFTAPEVESLCRQADLDYGRIYRHFGHRFVLAGEKPSHG